MSENSKIEWTDATWNPIRGCTRVSAGCQNCYAERVAIRFSGKGQAYDGLAKMTNGHPQWTGKVAFVEKHLNDPLKWKEPKRIFVNSMSDLFHEGVSDKQLDKLFAIMAMSPQHTFQILTKRPARMLEYLSASVGKMPGSRRAGEIQLAADSMVGVGIAHRRFDRVGWPMKNVWLGISCENQTTADERIPLLLQTPAAVRWISAEPLLGSLEISGALRILPEIDGVAQLPRVDWVVAGGESGPNARPMHPEWARSLRDQCKAAGVPFFFKQWGEWTSIGNNPFQPKEFTWLNVDGRNTRDDSAIVTNQGWRCMCRIGKKAAGRKLDGLEHNEYPRGAVQE